MYLVQSYYVVNTFTQNMNTPHACTRSICWVDKLDSQKKKEKSKKKISRKGLSQKSKKLILTIKYQLKDTFDVSPFLFILHAMVHPILIKLFKFTAFPSLVFTKFGNVLISNKRVTELHKKIIKCFQYFNSTFLNHFLKNKPD